MAGESPIGVGIRFELEGAEAALSALGQVVDRLEHPAPLFDAIGAMLVNSTKNRIQSGKGVDGNPWPKSIRVQLEGGTTLYDSGKFSASMTHNADDSGVEVGTDAIQGAVHQFGATIRPVRARALAFMLGGANVFAQEVTIPARPFLGLDDDDQALIEEMAGLYVLQPIEGGVS